MKPIVPRTRRGGVSLALVTAAISGVAVYVNGLGVQRFDDAIVYTTAKNTVAALVLLTVLGLALARRRDGAVTRAPRTRGAWIGLLLIGVVGGGLAFAMFFEGLARASSVDAAFLHKTLVIWVAVLAVPLLGERLSWLHLLAIGLLVGGELTLAGGGVELGAGGGEALILGATLLWAGEVVLAKRLLSRIGSLSLGTARLGVGIVVLVGVLIVSGRFDALTALSAEQWRWAAITGVLLAGYVGTWYAALARAQAVDVSAVLVSAAVITAAISGVASGTVPAGLPGLGLIVLGTVAVVVAARGREERAPA